MLPRFNGSSSVQQRLSTNFARQARISGHNQSSKRGVATVAVSRSQALVASCRLVLRPTGNGSFDHIGDKVPLPQAIPLKEGVFEVGRASPADIQIPIPTVSSRHALLRVEDNKVCITDLNSTNGTVVNGQELGPLDNIEVEVGAEVIFGDHFLARYQLDEDHDSSAAQQQQPELSDQASAHKAAHINNTVDCS
ncbi:SMAD/FHA domain-containing protein [Scenedesmus sp. NREL 46B-D3]|nr:SMAD/FHA domain-containing protein [Scenedesmus sp. NREL 46B-D3]